MRVLPENPAHLPRSLSEGSRKESVRTSVRSLHSFAFDRITEITDDYSEECLMRMKLGISVVLVTGSLLASAVGAGAATAPQYGAKCNDAWTGKRGTQEFRVYKRACMTAAIAATKAVH